MTKKIFTAIIFIIILFGINKVNAVEQKIPINLESTPIFPPIEIQKDGVWKEVNLEKHTADNSIIYEIDKNILKQNNINIGEEFRDERILRIIKNGYEIKAPADIETKNMEDAYAATRLAMDCALNRLSNRRHRQSV